MINGMIILNCGRLTSSAGPNPSVTVVPCYCAAAITAIATTIVIVINYYCYIENSSI